MKKLVLRCLAGVLALPAGAQDLSQVYKATLDREDDPEPLAWTSGPEDVWELSRFEFEIEGQLEVKLRSSTLVVGRCEDNAVFAVVLPDRPAKLDTTLGGDGESIRHVWLRFHPSRIGELFPAKTVRGHGPPEARLAAYRVSAHKMPDFWSTTWTPSDEEEDEDTASAAASRYARYQALAPFFGYRPVIPPKEVVVLDMDTEGGRRRAFSVDMRTRFVKARTEYVAKALPELPELDRRDVFDAYERACRLAGDLRASGLADPIDDWEAHAEACRIGLGRGATVFDLAAAVHRLLEPLDPENVWLRYGKGLEREVVPAESLQDRPAGNVSPGGVAQILASIEYSKENRIYYGRTQWGVAYVRVSYFDEETWIEGFDAALDSFANDWAVVLDLRYGFDCEPEIVGQMAGRFVEEPVPYGQHVVWKDGVEEVAELTIEPRGPWCFQGVVCALLGPQTSGEAERLALMIEALPRGFTVGDRTAGIGPAADWFELLPGLEVYHRNGRLRDASSELVPLDGLRPDTVVEVKPEELTPTTDPVLYKALEEIYLVPHPERTMARSGDPWPWPEDVAEAASDTTDEVAEAGASESE